MGDPGSEDPAQSPVHAADQGGQPRDDQHAAGHRIVSWATGAVGQRELAQRNEMLSEALSLVGFTACLLLAGWACTDQADRFFYWLATTIT